MKKRDVVVVRAAVFGSTGDWPTLKTVAEHTGGHVAMPYDERLTMVHEAKYGPSKRNLWRYEYETPWLGIVTGWSFRQTGNIVSGGGSWDDYEPGYLASDKYHKVLVIQPLHTERWLRPVACREEDVVKVDFTLRIEDGAACLEDNFTYPNNLMEYLADSDDFYTLVDHECSETLASSATDLYDRPEQAPVYLAYFSGELIKETVFDDWLYAAYDETSMGGELLLLEEL